MILEVLGLVCVVVGVAMWSIPAAFIVAGLALVGVGVMWEVR